MVSAAVVTVLAFLHIVFAVAWLGAVVFFVSVIGPALRTFTPGASLEFLVKVGPKITRYFAMAATATVIFGVSLLFAAFGTDYTSWPTSIEIGFLLGLVAYLDALLFTIPTSSKLDKIAHQMLNNPKGGPPPPEFLQNLKKANIGAISITIILMLAAVFMVGTAFPF